MERFVEHASATGYVEVLTFDGPRPTLDELHRIIYDGAQHERLVSHIPSKNRLSNYAVGSSAALWVGQSVITPSKIKLGVGTPPAPLTGPLTTDIDCWTPVEATARDCDVVTTFLTIYSEYGITYDVGELVGQGPFTEALLYDVSGNAWAHVLLATPLSQAANQTIVLLWKVQHSQNV
jgi:hypothetical protein